MERYKRNLKNKIFLISKQCLLRILLFKTPTVLHIFIHRLSSTGIRKL